MINIDIQDISNMHLIKTSRINTQSMILQLLVWIFLEITIFTITSGFANTHVVVSVRHPITY